MTLNTPISEFITRIGLGIGFTGLRKLFVNLFYGGIRNTFDVQSRKTKNRVVEFDSKKIEMFDFV